MIYADLLKALQGLSQEQLNMTVSVFDAAQDEIMPVAKMILPPEWVSDVVEANQPLLVVNVDYLE